MRIYSPSFILSAAITTLAMGVVTAQSASTPEPLEVTAQFESQAPHKKGQTRDSVDRPPAVVWLTPLDSSHISTPDTSRKYTLLQKNKEFIPHVLVVPVGSVVEFPNADPFFHNVFSLFDGRRFDLGLYEAGSSRGITFGKEGISYIFCNIHPDMSAVVIALSTPFFAVQDAHGQFRIPNVPPDNYLLQVWVQGTDPADLKLLARKVQVSPGHTDLGVISVLRPPHPSTHTNKYGKVYETREPPVY